MSEFSLILSQFVSPDTKISVYELCIDNQSLFERFVDEIKDDNLLFSKFAGAIQTIEQSANLIRLPKAKFRLIQGHNLDCKVYEAKNGFIRIYMFHEEHKGRIIVTGGLKNDQEKDINKVIGIINRYYDEKA